MSENTLLTLSEIKEQPEVNQDLAYFRNPANRPAKLDLDLSDISRRFAVSAQTIKDWSERPEDSFFTRQWKGSVAGVVRTGQQIGNLPQEFKNLNYRYSFANASPEMAEKLMEMGLRRQMARGEARAYHEHYEGTDDSIAANISGAFASALSYGAVAAMAGLAGGPVASSVAVGVLSGVQATLETAEQYAEKYAQKTGDFALKDYDKTADAIALGYGVVSGFIESSLGVESQVANLFKRTSRRTLVRAAVGFAEEGAEEGLQEFLGGVAGKIAGYEDRDWNQITKDSLESAVYGAIVGGTLGGSLYYVHRNRLARQFQKMGFDQSDARKLSDTLIDDTMEQTTREAFTVEAMQNKMGEPYVALVNKIETALNNAGWKEQIKDPDTGITRDVKEYANIVASDLSMQVLNQAQVNKIPANAVLNLADIDVVDNIVSLKPLAMGDSQQIQATIDQKKAQIKEINAKAKLLQGDPDRKKTLQTQIAVLKTLKDRKIQQENAQAEVRKTQLKDMGLENATVDARNDIRLSLTRPRKLKGERLSRARLYDVVRDDTAFEKVITSPEYTKVASVIDSRISEIESNPALKSDLQQALKRLVDMGDGDFATIITQQPKTGGNIFGQNALIYAMKFGDVNQVNSFIDTIQGKTRENESGATFAPNTFTQNDLYAQALRQVFPESFDENGLVKNREMASVFLSQNQQTEPNRLFQEQQSLANENARLDDIYPAYTGDTINIDGVARTVYNSNGDRIAQSEPALRNFWAWFGNSKVVDGQGRPLVVYHGTNAEFDTFEPRTNFRDMYGKPLIPDNPRVLRDIAWFSSNIAVAEKFGKANVLKVYLKIENPQTFDAKSERWDALTESTWLDNTPMNKDGIVVKNIIEGNKGNLPNATDYIVFNNRQIKSIDNRGTFSEDTGNIYLQSSDLTQGSYGGLYDPELNVIVLGKDFNTGTLPHELAHFWLQDIFNRYKSDANWTPEFTQQTANLFKILGVKETQTALTTEQHEHFARMTEAVIFGLATPPEGTNLPMLGYLNWIPPKYKSLQAIRYKDEQGRMRYPVLDNDAVDFFNRWYANPFMPTLGVDAPDSNDMENPNGQPALPSTVADRVGKIKTDVDAQNAGDRELDRHTRENAPVATQARMTAYEVDNSRKVNELNKKRDEILNPEKPSWLKLGRGTNKAENIRTIATEYVKKNKEHAESIAFGNPDQTSPDFVQNDSGIDRISLIREVMKGYEKGSREYNELYRNMATEATLAGKTTGLNNDISFQFYLDGYKRMYSALELRAAVAYSGTKGDPVAKFNRDIDTFIANRVDQILALPAGTAERNSAIDSMIREAEVQFAGDSTDSRLLLQENTLGQTATPKQREAFIAWANKYIKDHLVGADSKLDEGKLITLSDKAQVAYDDINATDPEKAIAAANVIKEWQRFTTSLNPSPSWFATMLGQWSPMAMLLSVNPHVLNMASTGVNRAIIKGAMNRAFKQYGNKVDQTIAETERKRIKQIYDATLLDYAQMVNPLTPALLHGEKIRIGKEDITIADGDKLRTKAFKGAKYLTYGLFGKEDFFYRSRAYIEALSYIATRDAKGDATVATQLFKEYAQVNSDPKSQSYKARKEAIDIANMTTFMENGSFARFITKVRTALNQLTGNPEVGLGTILAPFAKVPANVIEQGFRSLFAPARFVGYTWHKAKGVKDVYDFYDWKNAITFTIAAILAGAIAEFGDYEPPYDPSEYKKYDPKKPYDSIGFNIGGKKVWVKLDTFASLETPLRIMALVVTGKGIGVKETLANAPLLGDMGDFMKNVGQASTKSEKALRFVATFTYDIVDRQVPAIIKQIMSAANLGDADLENIDLGVKTGVGRRIGRRYGLDGDTRSAIDVLNDINAVIGLNRLKITE